MASTPRSFTPRVLQNLFGRGEKEHGQHTVIEKSLYVPDSPSIGKESREESFSKEDHTGGLSNETLDFPEGGRDAVMTVVGALLVDFAQTGVTSCVGVLQAQ